jgi:hypothetical protein
MSQKSNRVREHLRDSEEKPMFSRYAESAQCAMEEYPIGVMLGFFAAGIGLGAIIGAALAEPMGFRHRETAESIGRRVLNSISEYVPESLQRSCRG